MATSVPSRSITTLAESGDQSGVPHMGLPTLASSAFAQKGGIIWKWVSIRPSIGMVFLKRILPQQAVCDR